MFHFPPLAQVQTALENPTRYHVIQKQKNQVRQYLSESFQSPDNDWANLSAPQGKSMGYTKYVSDWDLGRIFNFWTDLTWDELFPCSGITGKSLRRQVVVPRVDWCGFIVVGREARRQSNGSTKASATAATANDLCRILVLWSAPISAEQSSTLHLADE